MSRVGMPVTVTIDAFPNRTFAGTVEKVQPQAIIQNSVTMFPVLVSIPNTDLSLLPGMNGEVSIVTQQRHNVLAVPNDAVRSAKDMMTAASVLGLDPDSLRQMMHVGRSRRSRGRGWGPCGRRRSWRRKRCRRARLGGGQSGQGGAGGGSAPIRQRRDVQGSRQRNRQDSRRAG